MDEQRATTEAQMLDAVSPASRVTLLRRFTLLALGTTIVVGVLFGALTARMVENFALRSEARSIAGRVLDLTASRVALQSLQGDPGAAGGEFERTMRDLSAKNGIVQVTAWNHRGEILYVSDGPAVHDPFPASTAGLALNGQLHWRLVSKARGERPPVPMLDTLIPVIASGNPEPVAFLKVVSDLSDLSPALARVIWSVQISVVLGVLMLYAALFTIVRRASGDLDRSESALRWAFVGIIRSLVNALDARDMATAHHSSRVAENAVTIARTMGLPEHAVHEVQAAAFLHDVGKIGISDDLLTKEGPLTPREREIMERHTAYGHAILEPVAIADAIKLAVRHSHERWDGRGYPDGLAGEAIPLAARIIAVADAYEALTSDRPYRAARSSEDALQEIARNAEGQFDPKVVDAALRMWNQAARARMGERMRGSLEQSSTAG